MNKNEIGSLSPEITNEKPKYKYLERKTIERGDKKVEEFKRLCLDPEGRPITIQEGDSQCGISSEDYFWRLNTDNFNSDNTSNRQWSFCIISKKYFESRQ